ncbi:hypothetical protein WICMUC_004755 [Wickerhamomyces mucosus]|uniref:Protein-S-isoprenylcysteine O-methyltransferase n=1 Tax=Wickerhamomyces mucosus TaxID=1378264 RepID=A0A9P8T9D5_9ASCO|nr:hypothetical protein WICMUC_004755 [Wickerhamomyces mucosus]
MINFIKKNLSPKKIVGKTINPMTSTITYIASGKNQSPKGQSAVSLQPELENNTENNGTPENESADGVEEELSEEIEVDKKNEEVENGFLHNSEKQLLPDIAKNPLDEVVVTAAGLGALFGFSATASLFASFRQPLIYIMALALFHFLEFWVTAKYNPRKVHKESFIINNGSSYTLAHTFAIVECCVEYFLFPKLKKSHCLINIIGLLLMIVGQFVRTLAMKTAGQSFSHMIATKHEDFHELVTTGVYSYLRHPSYTGFFWWAIGTQLLLLNPISAITFVLVLWDFFKGRISYEENLLVKFFGDRYVNYKSRTHTLIPFIP